MPGSQGNISTTFRCPWMRSQDFFTPKIQQNPMGIFLRRISFCNFRVYFGSQFGCQLWDGTPHDADVQPSKGGGETNTQTPAKLMSQICHVILLFSSLESFFLARPLC